ncbi:hypothetical protein [Aminipila luticellarii]|uniref:Uncharacterized protein n=1 Tax=Aminipila luticellarii TaxID=2507160 RepID=A0A410PX78_9FIRM|nr:hypothetical protein [Aminipila luticellarii]QAT43470.1 hypothetical protein EQM06_09720 [Aminipila luticellarii]
MSEWQGDIKIYKKGLEKVLKPLLRRRTDLKVKSEVRQQSKKIMIGGFESIDDIQDAFGYGSINDAERRKLTEQFEKKQELALTPTTVLDAEIFTLNWIIKALKDELENCE